MHGDIMTIQSHRYLSLHKLLYLLIIETVIHQYPARANTIIAALRGSDFLVVAADSRTIDAAGNQNDQTCKIAQLDARSFFASSGLKGNSDPTTIRFDVMEQAKIHYLATIPLSDNADIWANTVQCLYQNQPNLWKEETINGMRAVAGYGDAVTYGIFGRSNDHLDATVVKIKYWRNPITIMFDHRPPEQLPENRWMFWGSDTGPIFVNNLLRGDNATTSQWLLQSHKQAAIFGYGEVDTYAFELKGAIERAIDSGIDPGIGGEVAVLVIERGRAARWFSPTSACKAQN
jgi:hypothetical protein